MKRSYTVQDIDRMRIAVQKLVPRDFGIFCEPVSERDQARIAHWNAQVEDRLRTYMTAGVFPEELEKQPAPQEGVGK